jgi:hypothetical protein
MKGGFSLCKSILILCAHHCNATISAWPCSCLQSWCYFELLRAERPTPHASFFLSWDRLRLESSATKSFQSTDVGQMRSEPDESTLSVKADCIVKTALPLKNVIMIRTRVQDSLSSVFAKGCAVHASALTQEWRLYPIAFSS